MGYGTYGTYETYGTGRAGYIIMRIIAGTAKGRRLFAPDNRDIRPTSDRVRENLFNILMPRIESARFLDLFCGSGATGIEALSRGAQHFTFIDHDNAALQLTRRNLELCRLSVDGHLVRASIPQGLSRQPHPFDILFADPPYAFVDYEGLLHRLIELDFAGPDSLVILETSSKTRLPEKVASLCQSQSRRYGDTALTFFS